MKHDPDLYNDVVSRFFTNEMIKHVEEVLTLQGVRGSTVDLTPKLEYRDRMLNFARQYNGFEVKPHYTQEEEERIAAIYAILQDKTGKIQIELAIKGLENLSPEFKEQFPQYKTVL